MATYAIGDIQGCLNELEALLLKIAFNDAKDTLWFTGDLVNRGPKSLEVLRFVKGLGEKHQVVLGNHDLHLLALVYGFVNPHRGDTLDAILTAYDKDDLIDWLKTRPLLYHDKVTGFVLTHAGLAPAWTLKKAKLLAQEVEYVLRSHDAHAFLKVMYGNEPNKWDDNLVGFDRLRCIVNYLTRMRFCYEDGSLDLNYKGEIAGKPANLIPWFLVKTRLNANEKIIFGHWAALNGKTTASNLYALDTGCVWGNCLTAMRIEDEERFSVKCS